MTALKTDVCRTALISSKFESEGNTQPRIIDMQHIVRTQKPEEQANVFTKKHTTQSNYLHNVLHNVIAQTCNPMHIIQ